MEALISLIFLDRTVLVFSEIPNWIARLQTQKTTEVTFPETYESLTEAVFLMWCYKKKKKLKVLNIFCHPKRWNKIHYKH